jgi:hypothetical protein
MINNESITGYTVKYNHRSRDPKDPKGNVTMAVDRFASLSDEELQALLEDRNSS